MSNIPSPWWQVEGLAASGTWVALYHAKDKQEGREILSDVLATDTLPAHERFEDFRLVPPTDRRSATESIRERTDYLNMGKAQPRRRRSA